MNVRLVAVLCQIGSLVRDHQGCGTMYGCYDLVFSVRKYRRVLNQQLLGMPESARFDRLEVAQGSGMGVFCGPLLLQTTRAYWFALNSIRDSRYM